MDPHTQATWFKNGVLAYLAYLHLYARHPASERRSSRMPTYAKRPATGEFAPYYAPYIALVPEGDIADILESQIKTTATKLRTIPEERGTSYESLYA